jgi:hypothetical protein
VAGERLHEEIGTDYTDILDDLNGWLALLVVERRYRQQAGEDPGADMDLVTRAIDEIASLRSTLAAKDASFEA